MTDEQRKAAVEKAAVAMWWAHNSSVAWTTPEEGWRNQYTSRQKQFRDAAQAALEAVGYFKLVEAAEEYREACEVLEATQEKLFAALKEATP